MQAACVSSICRRLALITFLLLRGRRMRFPSGLTDLIFMALISGAANAAPVTYTWMGTVTSSTGNSQPGSVMSISVTLDNSYPADPNTEDPKVEATYTGGSGSPSGTSPVLAVTINGVSALGWFDSVHIQKNRGGVSEISIQSSLPQCCRSFIAVFTTTMKGVVKSVAIPKTLFPANFQSSTFGVVYTQSDSFGGTLK